MTLIQWSQRGCPDLCGGDGEARGVIRARARRVAQLQQLLDVLDRPQNFVPHALQRRSVIVGTHALSWAALAFGPVLVMRLPCEVEKRQSRCEPRTLSCGIGDVREGLTVFVLLHLNAAVVDTLDAAQATHLFVNAEILDRTEG